jgi:hypothetical protein
VLFVFGVAAVPEVGKPVLVLEKKVLLRNCMDIVGITEEGFLPTITKDPARLQAAL